MKHELTNEQCRDQAKYMISVGNFAQAMRWYNTARARTIGHKKSDSYEALAIDAAKAGSVSFDRNSFASDDEAVKL